MSTPLDSRDDLPQLLSALEDCTLDASGQARLVELLQTDPTARAKYYDHVVLAALLRREGRRAAAQSDNVVGTLRVPTASDGTRGVPATSARSRLWLAALAASVLLMLALSVSEATGVTQLVPTIVRIATGEGSLVIEVDDPSVSVTLDGQDVTITGAGIHELKLRPGTHKFTATKDGRPAHSEIVTIHKGQRKVVAVRLEPAPAPQHTLPVDAPSLSFVGHAGPVWSVAFTPDGRRLVSTSLDGTTRVWDVATRQEIARFAGHGQCVYQAAILPDGKRVLSGSGLYRKKLPDAGTWSLCLWELDSGQELQRASGDADEITSIVLSADGKRALVGRHKGSVMVWDVEAWRKIQSLATAPLLWHADWSADESRIVTASGFDITAAGEYQGGLKLWDLTADRELNRLDGHDKGMWNAVFSPGGDQIASTGGDYAVRLWNSQTGALEHEFKGSDVTTSVAYSPSGKFLLTGNYGVGPTVRLWNLATKQQVASFSGHTNGVQCVAISKNGRWAASGSHDGTVRLWELPAEVGSQKSESK